MMGIIEIDGGPVTREYLRGRDKSEVIEMYFDTLTAWKGMKVRAEQAETKVDALHNVLDAARYLRSEMDAHFVPADAIFAIDSAIENAADIVECSRHPEPAADPQETADGGERFDIPDPANSLAMSHRREIESATDWDKASAPGFRHTPIDTAKTAIPEPVPPRTLEGDSEASHNGTQMRDALMALYRDQEHIAVNSYMTRQGAVWVFNDTIWEDADPEGFAIMKTARDVLGLEPFVFDGEKEPGACVGREL